MAASDSVGSAPLLKWPGGKRALLPQLRKVLPQSFRTYYEPFAGGAALFFDLKPESAVLSDTNSDLIECYRMVRDDPESVIAILGSLRNTREDYYAVRSWRPSDGAGGAARLIYLMTLAFNGIYRVNRRGEFNVPYGRKGHLVPGDPERIRAASAAFRHAQLTAGDFETVVSHAGPGDFLYLDPPYTVFQPNNGFLKYNKGIFSWEDQARLAEVASRLSQNGCQVLVSNADHPSIRALYDGFCCHRVRRPSVIAAASEHRGQVTECLFHRGYRHA